jgi:monoamine oxidase
MMAAVKATTYSATAKMGLQMKRRFWEEDDRIFGGHLYSDLPLGEFSYPSNDYFTQKGVLLGFYGNGRQASLVNVSVKARLEHVLMHASKVHPQIREEYESGYTVFWERIKYSLGAYAAGGGGGGQEDGQGRDGRGGGRGQGRGGNQGRGGRGSAGGGSSRLAQLSRPDNRIFLGCAAVSTSPAWLEGAVSAAWGTVRSVHERAMRA